MGLDLHHFYSTHSVSEQFVNIDANSVEIADRRQYFKKKINHYIDFDRIFRDRSLILSDYILALKRLESGWGTAWIEKYYFCNSANPDPEAPDLFFTNERSLLGIPPKSDYKHAKKMKKYRIRPYPMKEQEDDVLYLEAVAYQRKDVDDEFFEEFPPNFTTSDFTKVKRILDLTYPEAKSTFHQGFIDLWDNERSVLVVSW